MIDRLVLSSILKKKKIIYLFIISRFPTHTRPVLMENSEKPSNDFSRFFTVRVLIGRTSKFIPPPRYKKGGGGGWMEPLPGVFNMLQYFETILPLLERL